MKSIQERLELPKFTFHDSPYRAQAAFSDLEASYKAFELLSSPHGTNYPWLSTAIYLRTAESSISSLLAQLVEAIDTADKSPSRVKISFSVLNINDALSILFL